MLPLGVWAADAHIVLHSKAIHRSPLFLHHIATIQAPKETRSFLQNIEVSRKFLDDGKIEKKEIQKLLRKHLIDPKMVRIDGGPVFLYHKKSRLSKEDLLKAVTRYIRHHHSNVQITKISLYTPSIPLRGGLYRLEILESHRTPTHIYLDLRIFDAQGFRKRLRPTILVQTFAKVPFAKHDISKGSLIEEEDIEWKTKVVRSKMPLTPGQVIGAVAIRPIRQGQQIKEWSIEPDYAVKKNRNVKIVYQKGPIHIELLGLALQNGQIGDVVRVKNLSTNKVLRCKVLQNGVVRYLY